MPPQLPPPVIGAFISSFFAIAIALYSLAMTHRARRLDTTRDVLKRYFSADFTVIRRESFPALQAFWTLDSSGADTASSPLLKYLINRLPHEVVLAQTLGRNHLSPEQNTLIFLYFWAELQAYQNRKLLDPVIIREVLISQWEFYRDVLMRLVTAYEHAVSNDAAARSLSVPPWATAIKAIDTWIGKR